MKGNNNPVDQLHFLIGTLYGIYRHIASNMGLSESAFWSLYLLAKSNKELSQSDLAEALSLPKQAINSSIKGLVHNNLISLIPDPSISCSKFVQLTANGNLLVQEAIIPLQQAEHQALFETGAPNNALYEPFTRLLHVPKRYA